MKPVTKLSKAIDKALKKCGFMVERVQTGEHRVRGGYLRCASNGTPDRVVVGLGWIEIKRPGEKLSDDQEDWHRRAIARGARVAVVRSVQEAVETVVEWRASRG